MKNIRLCKLVAGRPIITKIIVGMLVLCGYGAANGAEPIVNSDFGKCPVKIDNPMDGKRTGSFKGVLPDGWRDDFSGWSKSQAESQVVAEDGKSFWRINTLKADSGSPQFAISVPNLEDGYYKLTIRARNTSTGPLLKVGLRIVPPPYRFLFEKQVASSDTWSEKSWSFKLENKTKALLGIFLIANGYGSADIAFIRLEKISIEDMAANIKRPDASVRNFFRNSRLPLGLQAGWSLGRECAEVSVAPDATCAGPSGATALKLETKKECVLFSEPFQVSNALVKNRASLSFKGSGKWRISVLQSGREITGKNIEPGDAWKRESISFSPELTAKSFALKITGTGTLWVDAFAAYSEDKDRPYESAGECEVAFGLPKSEIDDTRIQFDNEPAILNYCVTGNNKDAILKTKVFNVYGQEKALPDIDLNGALMKVPTLGLGGGGSEPGFSTSGQIEFDVFPETPYGQFRVEAWIERGGKRVSPFNEMVVTRLKHPLFWGKDAPESPFGCHFLSVDRTIRTMKAGGVNWARLHDAGFEYIGWWWLEPEKGKWTFHDDDINRYRANNMKIFAQLGTAPKWASYLSKADTGREWISYHDRYFQPLSLDEFANYAKTVAARYKGVIDQYFVWNEPWIHRWWAVGYDKSKSKGDDGYDGYITSEHPQADFAKLMKTAYASVKTVDASIKVSGFNTTTGKPGIEWTQGVYDADGFSSCDLIDYHFYTNKPQGYPGNSADSAYKDALGYVIEKKGRLEKPVYMSEGQGSSNGSPTGDGIDNAGIYKHALPYASEEDSIMFADTNSKFVMSILSNNVSKVFLYSAHCYGNLGSPNDLNILLCGDGYAHPSLAALSNLARHIEGRTFVKTVKLGKGISAYLFKGDGRTAAIISGEPGCASYQLPGGDIEVTDLFGNSLPGKTICRGRLVFADSPLSPEALESLLGGK